MSRPGWGFPIPPFQWPHVGRQWPAYNVESDQADGLVMWLPYGGGYPGAHQHIDTISGLVFTEGGTPVWVADGERGWSMLFDDAANEYLEVDHPVITGTPYTLSGWFRTDDGVSPQYVINISDKDVANQQTSLLINYNPSLSVSALTYTAGSGLVRAISTASLVVGRWQLITGVFESPTARACLLDGANKGTNANNATPLGLDRTSIGRAGDSTPGAYMSGCIADVRVYDRALTDLQVAELSHPDTEWELFQIPRRLWRLGVVAAEGIEVTPGAALVETALAAPSVELGSISVTPSVATAVAALVEPGITLGDADVVPAFTIVTVVSIAPIITLGELAIPPPEAIVVAALVAPSITLSSTTAEPTEAVAETALVAPSVALGALVVAPSDAAATTSLVAPSVVLSSVVVAPPNSPVEAAFGAPGVELGLLALAPSASAAEVTAVAPTVDYGPATSTPPTADVIAAALAPEVSVGGLEIAPDSAIVTVALVAPSVGLSSLGIAPSCAIIVTALVAPVVVLGGVSIAPSVAIAEAALVAPVVVGALDIAPPSARAVAASIAPSVVLGSISITPSSGPVVADAVSPSVEAVWAVIVPIYRASATTRTWVFPGRTRAFDFAALSYRQYIFTARERRMSTKYQIAGDILIQPSASGIGPFTFRLGPQLPSGNDIVSVVVKAYLDNVDKTSDLISSTPTVASNVVSVYFKYPGVSLHGEYKLTFIYTLVGGEIDEADFFKVRVADH